MITSALYRFGQNVLSALRTLGGIFLLFQQSVRELFTRPHYVSLIIDQVNQIGLRSTTIVFAAAISTGMVMALQFGIGLEKFGGKLYVPSIVSLSIVRELGPVFTSLMLAGRVGAGIASEIGSMVVTQQIDAIRALGTSPIKRVVIPRVVATVIALPILSIMANTIGIIGAAFVGVVELGLDFRFFINKTTASLVILDYGAGLIKTIFFALFISVPACYYGLSVSEGTRGVGMATTRAVVTGSVLIVLSDFFLTKLIHFLIET